MQLVTKMSKLEHLVIRDSLDYRTIVSLSNEAKTKLSDIRPRTLGRASRISGVSPADIAVLMVFLNA